MDIYILAGQSNMAGRGVDPISASAFNFKAFFNSSAVDIQAVNFEPLTSTSRYTTYYSQRVERYSALGKWEVASEPLHKDIDLRKASRCGVGPAYLSSVEVIATVHTWMQNGEPLKGIVFVNFICHICR